MMRNEPVDSSEAKRICMGDGNSVWAVSDGELLARIARTCKLRNFSAGETIVEEGKETTIVGAVVTGVLKMVKSMTDGREQIVGLLTPSDMFGRVYAPQGGISIEAATDATLCTFERRAFEDLMREYPELERKVLVSVLDELDAARDWMLLLGCQTVQERIASFLLMLARRSKGHLAGLPVYRVQVPVGRKDMAAFLGTTTETISRTIQGMAKGGVIRIVNPLCFEIVSHEELVAMSGREEHAPARPERLQQRSTVRSSIGVPVK
jgi:CRP/FNR family transcriptional regulator